MAGPDLLLEDDDDVPVHPEWNIEVNHCSPTRAAAAARPRSPSGDLLKREGSMPRDSASLRLKRGSSRKLVIGAGSSAQLLGKPQSSAMTSSLAPSQAIAATGIRWVPFGHLKCLNATVNAHF